MIPGKKPLWYGKSKVLLQLQNKRKVFWTVVLKDTDRQADRQGRTAALKQGQCLSVQLNSVTPASRSARTIQNSGCGEAVGTRSSDLAVFSQSGEPWNDEHVTRFEWTGLHTTVYLRNCDKQRSRCVVLHILNIARLWRSSLGSVCLTLTSVCLSGFRFNLGQHS